ncbi:hypothetical protein AGMMS50212_03100 [Spirochaetia bacterium]|nr:hypothetical protein AGMMS50212_03100 [Spirochaetia bacterium]
MIVVMFIQGIMKKILPGWLSRLVINQRLKLDFYNSKYSGNNVLCPCCGKTFKAFMNFDLNTKDEKLYPGNFRRETMYPNCYSSPRHRIACYYFDNPPPP